MRSEPEDDVRSISIVVVHILRHELEIIEVQQEAIESKLGIIRYKHIKLNYFYLLPSLIEGKGCLLDQKLCFFSFYLSCNKCHTSLKMKFVLSKKLCQIVSK